MKRPLSLTTLGIGVMVSLVLLAPLGPSGGAADAAPAGGKSVGMKAKPDKPNAQDVLAHMTKVYESCRSFRDSGVMKTAFIQPGGNRIVEKPFTTVFVRPQSFRFEYREMQGGQERRYIVWRDGNQIQTWWDARPGVEMPASLRSAIVAATGVSGGAAHTVPGLLLPKEIGGRVLTEITQAKRITDAKLGKVDCFCLQGDFVGHRTTLWIDRTTFLLRKVLQRTEEGDLVADETTTYDPAVDKKIPDELLEFNAPGQK